MADKMNYKLFDTSYILSYEEYVEDCKANNREPKEENSEDYWEAVNFYQELEWNDFQMNMKYSKFNDLPVVVSGTLGLWNGSPAIFPKRFDSVLSAIKSAVSGADDVDAEVVDGVIYVNGHHHDGTNRFEIHLLSAKGIKASEKWNDGVYYGDDFKDYWVKKFNNYLF